jgi:YggT family protein
LAPPDHCLPARLRIVKQNAAETIVLWGGGRYLCHNPLWLEPDMPAIYNALQFILFVVKWIILAHFIMSWLINFQVLNLRQPLVAQAWNGLNRRVQPIYGYIRRYIPAMVGLDFAPLVVLLVIYGLQILLERNQMAFF